MNPFLIYKILALSFSALRRLEREDASELWFSFSMISAEMRFERNHEPCVGSEYIPSHPSPTVRRLRIHCREWETISASSPVRDIIEGLVPHKSSGSRAGRPWCCTGIDQTSPRNTVPSTLPPPTIKTRLDWIGLCHTLS